MTLSGFLHDFAAARAAEMVRIPSLVGTVIPELVGARLRGRETLGAVLTQSARRWPDAPALICEGERLSFRTLDSRVWGAAAWLEGRGLRRGDVAALVGPSSIEAVIALMGAARAGVTLALVGLETTGSFLDAALKLVRARALLVDASEPLARSANGDGQSSLPLGRLVLPRFESASPDHAGASLRDRAMVHEDFAFIYTSGTTGPMKAARVTHRRALLAASTFGRLVHRMGPGDVVYCPLPLNHSSGLLLGLAACLVTGAALAFRKHFSARAFLPDVRRYRATVLLYIGEVPRALLALPPSPEDRAHSLRAAVGNGMSADVWPAFRERFAIREVCEFYAATEFPGAIVNVTNRVGSVGHIPLERWRGYRVVRVDPTDGSLARDERGRAIECAPGEPGELVQRLKARPGRPTGDYAGYVDERESSSRIARGLFAPDDVYCRSGDLFRRDRSGHYFFVDRLGDSFRFKGENVSTREVETLLSGMTGVEGHAVVGVRVPGIDGQPPMLVLATRVAVDFGALEECVSRLPKHARPCFVRVVPELPLTASHKIKKRELAAQGVDPERVGRGLYLRRSGIYEPLTADVYRQLVSGALRLQQ